MPDGPLSRLLLELVHPDLLWHKILMAVGGLLRSLIPVAIVLGILIAIAMLLWVIAAILRRRAPKGGSRVRILPPPGAEATGGEALWTGLHGLIPPRWKRLLMGTPPLVWEVVATCDGIEISLFVPESVSVAFVERAIETAWPGSSLIQAPTEIPFPTAGSHVKTSRMTLALPEWHSIGPDSSANPLGLLLGSMSNLSPDESSVLQVIARPQTPRAARAMVRKFNKSSGRQPSWPLLGRAPTTRPSLPRDPTADSDLRAVHAKAAATLWGCSVRIGFSAPTRGGATTRVHSLATAFSMFEGRNGFRRRRMFRGACKIAARRPTKGFLLSMQELAKLATLPVGHVPGIDAAGARIVAPPRALPSDGKVLGVANSGIVGREVAIAPGDARHHVHIIGETGTGKSALIANLVLQDAAAGRAAVVIDPKGDLVEAILQRLPKGAEHRTCLIDPTDASVSVGLNVLVGDDLDLIADHVAGVFKRIYERHWGPRSDDIMRAACLTLAQIPGATLTEMPLLLTNPEWRRAIRVRLSDPALRLFWEQFDSRPEAKRSEDISPVMNKLRAFLLRGAIRTILGQAKPKHDIEGLLDTGGLILVRIPKGLLGEDCSKLLAGLVIGRVWQAAMKRASQPEEERGDLTLYVDEMHNYLTMPRSFEDLLAEARGYGLSLVLAHQHMGQLTKDMREALESNARTKIVFACSPGDARQLEDHFEPTLSRHDLSHLPLYGAACRPCIEGAHGQPFTFVTKPLQKGSSERAIEVRIASGERFGEKRSAVEAAIRTRQIRPEIMLLPARPDRSSDQSVDQSPEQSVDQRSVTEPEGDESPGEAA